MVVLLHVAVNRFRQVTEPFGPQVGDRVLIQFAERIQEYLDHGGGRRLDSRLARIGGTEFGVLITGLENIEQLSGYGRNIARAVSGDYHVDGHDVHLDGRVGICSYPIDAQGPSELMHCASSALGAARLSEVDQCCYYSESANEQSKLRLRKESLLRRAIENQELRVEYQPKLSVETDRIVGAEALLRWHNEELGPISPAEFIPLAEETGVIVDIGQWVLSQVLEQINRWENTDLASSCGGNQCISDAIHAPRVR